MNTFEHIEKEDSLQVTIYSRASLFVKTVLAVLTLMSISGFMGIAFFILERSEVKFVDILISFLTFSIILLFVGRLFLWNSFGKEILNFKNGTFSFQYDYKLFKSDIEHINYASVSASRYRGQQKESEFEDLIDDKLIEETKAKEEAAKEEEWKKGKLEILLNQESYQSPINLTKEELQRLIYVINDFGGQ